MSVILGAAANESVSVRLAPPFLYAAANPESTDAVVAATALPAGSPLSGSITVGNNAYQVKQMLPPEKEEKKLHPAPAPSTPAAPAADGSTAQGLLCGGDKTDDAIVLGSTGDYGNLFGSAPRCAVLCCAVLSSPSNELYAYIVTGLVDSSYTIEFWLHLHPYEEGGSGSASDNSAQRRSQRRILGTAPGMKGRELSLMLHNARSFFRHGTEEIMGPRVLSAEWVHMAFVFHKDKGSLRIFHNGVKVLRRNLKNRVGTCFMSSVVQHVLHY